MKFQSFFNWILLIITTAIGATGIFFTITQTDAHPSSISMHEAGFENPLRFDSQNGDTPIALQWKTWQRKEGPYRVALQAGHWKMTNVPPELYKLKKNGASFAGIHESELNLLIAKETKRIIETMEPDIIVDILPTTVPPDYLADIFIAIHADGNADQRVRGYKVAAPWRDATHKAQNFADILAFHYEKRTGIPLDPNITENMRGYYAFNWRKYAHSMHPMTVGVILEVGFLTNSEDRNLTWETPEIPSQAIADAVMAWITLPEAI